MTLSAGSAADLAAAAVQRVADGFSTLKMKVGTDAATDVARVRAVREAVGPDVTIRLDANQGWTPDEAVTVIRALERADLGVELVEQPVRGEDVEGLAAVRSRVGLPVMADEALYSLVDLERIIRLEAADLVNVKLAKCGSLGVALEQLRRATEAGLGTMVGSMMETAIGVGAVAAVAAAHPTSVVDDLDAAWWAAASPVVGGVEYDGDRLVLSSSVGSGVAAVECNRLRWLHDVVDRPTALGSGSCRPTACGGGSTRATSPSTSPTPARWGTAARSGSCGTLRRTSTGGSRSGSASGSTRATRTCAAPSGCATRSPGWSPTSPRAGRNGRTSNRSWTGTPRAPTSPRSSALRWRRRPSTRCWPAWPAKPSTCCATTPTRSASAAATAAPSSTSTPRVRRTGAGAR